MKYLERYLHHLKRWWWVVIVATFVVGGASYWVASVSPGPYRASSTLLVNLTQTPGIIVLDDVLVSERLTSTYEELITTRPILEEAASRLGGPETVSELRASIDVSVVTDTQLIQIAAESDDPDRAALMANTVADVFIEENNLQAEGARPGTVSVVESAVPPEAREGPSLTVRTILGVLAGVSVGLILVVGRTYFDNTVWTPGELGEIRPGVQCLGVIPRGALKRFHRRRPAPSVPPLTEAYRTLATNVLSARRRSDVLNEGCQMLAIVSAIRGEGRTSIAARLGVAIALDGNRVTLVDFDLRSPTLHQEFGVPNESGISQWLSSTSDLMNAGSPRETSVEGLKVVTCGQSSEPSAERRTGDVRRALERLKRDSPDFVIFDTPPLADGVEAVVLGQLVDSAVVIVEAKRTALDLVASTVGELDAIGLPILGIVLNKR